MQQTPISSSMVEMDGVRKHRDKPDPRELRHDYAIATAPASQIELSRELAVYANPDELNT
jgi:hypothetical protein